MNFCKILYIQETTHTQIPQLLKYSSSHMLEANVMLSWV